MASNTGQTHEKAFQLVNDSFDELSKMLDLRHGGSSSVDETIKTVRDLSSSLIGPGLTSLADELKDRHGQPGGAANPWVNLVSDTLQSSARRFSNLPADEQKQGLQSIFNTDMLTELNDISNIYNRSPYQSPYQSSSSSSSVSSSDTESKYPHHHPFPDTLPFTSIVGPEKRGARASRRRGGFRNPNDQNIYNILGNFEGSLRENASDVLNRLTDNGKIADFLGFKPPDIRTAINAANELMHGQAGALEGMQLAFQQAANANQGHGDIAVAGNRMNADINNDGQIDRIELAIDRNGNEISRQLHLLHPLIARAHRDPSFMRLTITKQKIDGENVRKQSSQVHMVTQGIAGHMADVNMFNVNY